MSIRSLIGFIGGQDTPVKSRLTRFTDTLSGAGTPPGSWYFALDAAGDALQQLGAEEQVDFLVSRGGEVVHARVEFNAHSGRRRLAFTVIPKSAEPVDIRAQLILKEKPISETTFALHLQCEQSVISV